MIVAKPNRRAPLAFLLSLSLQVLKRAETWVIKKGRGCSEDRSQVKRRILLDLIISVTQYPMSPNLGPHFSSTGHATNWRR